MTSCRFVVIALTILASNPCQSMSRPFHDDITAVLRDGSPCFFITKYWGTIPSESKLEASVYMADKGADILQWRTWFGTHPVSPPISIDNCLPYGISEPNHREKNAIELKFDTRYSAEMFTEYGTFFFQFCLKKNSQGENYLTKVNRNGHCTSEPLDAARKFRQ